MGLLEVIEHKLKDLGIEHSVNQNKCKVIFEAARDTSDLSCEDIPREGGHVRMQMKITEVDKQRVAIQFKKLAGSAFMFRDQICFMQEQLTEFNDAMGDPEPEIKGQDL